MKQLPRTGKGFLEREYYNEFRQLLYDIIEGQQPMTVRQVFYRAVVKGYVEKTEQGYGFIQRDLVQMRWNGKLPFGWIIDTSRNTRGGQGWNQSVEEFMEEMFEEIPDRYTRNLLANHDFSIQVWLEKEALARVIWPMCMEWDVPLYCARGYSSLTFLHEAAQSLERKDRPAKIFHFGDYDPSGQDAIATVQRDLPALAPKTAEHGLEFRIVAVKPEQIPEMNLPTRPTKRTDTRAASFGDESVELDAIEPNELRRMVTEILRGCFPAGAHRRNERLQEEGRREIRQRLRELGLI
jgi:hypothetical protein